MLTYARFFLENKRTHTVKQTIYELINTVTICFDQENATQDA